MKTIPALTGVRAIAAFLIFFHHASYPIENSSRELPIIKRVFEELHIGVTLFFVLSGFLIHYRYYKEWSSHNFSWKNYIKNRFARIYPIYFILTTGTFASNYLLNHLSGYSKQEYAVLYTLNITFLRGFFDNLKFSGIIQGWSLTVEECFYLSAPVIFWFINRRQWLISLLLTYLVGIGLVLLFKNQSNLYGLFENFRFLFGFTFWGRCFEFFSGMLLSRLIQNEQVEVSVRRSSLFTGLGAVFICGCVALLVLITHHYKVQQGGYHPIGRILNNLILPIAICVFFVGLIRECNVLTRLIGSSLFIKLGKASYVFYLIHYGMFYDFMLFLFPFDSLFIPFVLLNIFSLIIFQFVEEPLNNWIRNTFNSKRQYAVPK